METITENLWRVISRFDEYIRAADNKAAVVATFAVFEFGVSLERFDTVLESCSGKLQMLTLVVFALGFVAALAAIGALIWAVLPNTNSPGPTEQYASMLFFGHVAKDPDGATYGKRVSEISEVDMHVDLAHQAHALAGIARHKYHRLGLAIQAVSAAAVLLPLGLILNVFL